MNRQRVLSVASKELMHILRDPFTLALALGLPVIMVLFFGWAIDFDFRGVPLAVYDFDQSRQSRQLAAAFSSSGYFTVRPAKGAFSPIDEVTAERAFGALIIPPGFDRDIRAGGTGGVQLLLDGSDNQKAGLVGGFCAGIVRAFNERLRGETMSAPAPELRTRFLYNPELNTAWFIVPGLIVVVTGLLSILLTALTIAREWENGSMELLLSTPLTPQEVIAGKILPYVVFVLTGVAFVYGVARAVFGIPFAGSHAVLIGSCVLYIVVSLAQGILISTITRTQQKAMQAALMIGLLPSMLLSGFIFPIESMPAFFHYFTIILPPRWFMEIIRGVFLKGTPVTELLVPLGALTLMMAVFITAAVKRSRRDLE